MPVSINNTTLTFNDASTQTTSGVTSVGAGTGISSTGGKTPTLTNTGVTSVTAGTGISVSASTGGVTITNSSPGAVSSVNGQTDAVVTTSRDAIGSSFMAAYCGTSNLFAGDTTAGSNLRYATSITQSSRDNGEFPSYTSEGSFTTNPQTIWEWANDKVRKPVVGNPGFQNPGGTAALTGTYRAMQTVLARWYSYDGESNVSQSQPAISLFVRVS